MLMLVSIRANGTRRATFNSLDALTQLVWCLWLLENISPALLIALSKNSRCCLVAQLAINAR